MREELVESIVYYNNLGWIASYIVLNGVDDMTMQFTSFERRQQPLKDILEKKQKPFGISTVPSHQSRNEYEKIYPTDKIAPKLIKIPVWTVYTPAIRAEAYEVMHHVSDCTIYENSQTGELLLIAKQAPIILAEAYCIAHRINEQSFAGTYYYDKRKNRTPSVIWFPTYITAKGTADYIREYLHDAVTVEKHYIQF